MIDPKICQEVIQRVLPELKIDHIKLPNSQEEINFAPNAKGVRFDVFTRDTKKGKITKKLIIHMWFSFAALTRLA